jgi:hypothetical protein
VDKWITFFEPFFADRDSAVKFVQTYEVLELDHPLHSAKIMVHQTQRLVSLSDDLPAIRPGKESLQLLFLLVCAEHVAKLHDNFDGEGQSRAYVRKFFESFFSEKQQETLRFGVTKWDRTPHTLREAIDVLYGVRCDVVHEGRYWGFHFSDGNSAMMNGEPDVIVNMRLCDLRDLVVLGCINAVSSYNGRPN